MKYLHLLALLLLAHSATAQQPWKAKLDSAAVYQNAENFEKVMVFAKEAEKLLAEAKQTNTSDYAEVLDYMGDEHSRNNKYSQADSLYRVALAVREIIFGKIDSNYAVSIGKLAILNLTRSQYKLAESLQEQCIDILQKTIGKNNKRYIDNAILLGLCCSLTNNLTRAEEILNEAKALTKQVLGENTNQYADVLKVTAMLYNEQAKYAQAEILYRESARIYGIMGNGRGVLYTTALSNLAQGLQSQDKFEESIEVMEKAVAINREGDGKEDPKYASYIGDLGFLYRIVGRYVEAEVLIREALQIVEQKQGKNHLEYAQRLIVLAALYEDKGQYKEALQLRIEALATQEKLLGSEHPDIARALNGIAMDCNRVNDFLQAETCYKRSLAIAEKTVKKTHPIYFYTLANIAVLYSTLGNHEQARVLSEQSLELKKAFYGEMSTNYALALGNHAVALADVIKTDKTINNSEIEQYFLKAINIYKNNLLGKEKEYAPLLENFGSYYLQYTQDYPMAEKWLLEASDVIKNKFGNTHFSYIENLSNLSELYDKMGKDSLALHYATTALTDYNKYFGKGTRNYSRVLVNLINVYRNQGIYKQAAEKSCEAIDLTIKQIRQTFTFLSEREQQKYMAFNGNLVTKFYSLAHQSPDSAFLSRICNLSLLVKGLSLQTGTQLKKGIEDSHDSTATALLDRLNALRASLGAQYQKPLEKQFRVVEMLQEAEDTEKQLMAQSSAFKTAMSGLNANWRTIQAALKPNEAAIEWVAYRYFNKDWTDTTYYAAFVIRPKATAPQFVLACSEKQLIELLASTQSTKPLAAIDDLYSNKSKLYKTVWQPLEKYLTGCQTLYLSPTGILNRLSFAAIASPNGQPLYARYNLHTMSHLRTLLDQNPNTPFPTTAALFGGIDYETASLPPVLGGIEGGSFNSRFVAKLQTRERSGLGNWEPLPGTLTELNDVATLLKTNKATILKYAGSSASEDNFKALGGQHVALLHVGTHGFVYPADTSKNDNAALTLIANPLLRTGLVLAGAKRNKLDTLAMNAGKEDGILTAYETAQINLNGTELVVLSACESGLGDIRGAEGVYGLQRGFKLAGAKKLLMSLWKVNDQTTAQYMKTFYGKWKTTQNLTTAYQQTQTTMRAAYPTRPDVWAAFVLVE